MQIKDWIHAFRLRTLPLALSSIAMGAFVAAFFHGFKADVTIWAAITTLFLQILSNLSNDYGDHQKGTDNHMRVGPQRAVQSGRISPGSMRLAIIVFVGLSLISGIVLIISGTRGLDNGVGLTFLVLGILAIAASVFYTVGKRAYGYSGFGDLFVFIFFGLLAVIGTYFLNTQQFRWDILLPASSLGFLSTGVLNLNNLRDRANDKVSGKITVAVRLGVQGAKLYHFWLIVLAVLAAVVFNLINFTSIYSLAWAVIMLPLFGLDLLKIYRINNLRELDPFLKKLALETLLFVLLFGGCLLLA